MARKQYAANFYAGASHEKIERFIKGFKPPQLAGTPVAGVVPHAGWDFSGAVAAKVFDTIRAFSAPKTFILFGTVHRGIRANGLYSRGAWLTPFGEVTIDEELADRLLEQGRGLVQQSEEAHEYEHSIEVQMPLLKHFFPEAMAVPIAVLPDAKAPVLGARVGEFLRDNGADAAVVGTTDLTHYGDAYMFTPSGYGPQAHEWMKQNDMRIIELAKNMRAEDIVPEAHENMNACGGGALAATVGAARALGSEQGLTIEYTTSYDVMPEQDFRMAVGYAGMVFCGP
jgi:hypothetical protein